MLRNPNLFTNKIYNYFIIPQHSINNDESADIFLSILHFFRSWKYDATYLCSEHSVEFYEFNKKYFLLF